MPVAPVAGFSPYQEQAFGATQQALGMAQPYFGAGAGYLAGSAAPISPWDVAQYYNPMAQNITNQMQNIFGQQMRETTGNLTGAAGGVGASRIAVGQGNLANQQGLAAGQTYANLYQQALQAAQQQKQMMAGAGYGLGQMGPAAQMAQLQSIGALGQAGAQQQALQQAQLSAQYQNQLARIAYPFQTPQYLAGIAGGLGPAMGGTTTGVTTYPTPSPLAQGLGIGTSLLGLAGGFGGLGTGLGQLGGGFSALGSGFGSMFGGSSYPYYGPGYQRGGSTYGNLAEQYGEREKALNPYHSLDMSETAPGEWNYADGGDVDQQQLQQPPLPFPGASVPVAGGVSPIPTSGQMQRGISPIPYAPVRSAPANTSVRHIPLYQPTMQQETLGSDISSAIRLVNSLNKSGLAAGGSVNPYDFGQGFQGGGDIDLEDTVPLPRPNPLGGLTPSMREEFPALRTAAAERGINFDIGEGYRPQERQNQLYAQGRTAPGPIVTQTPYSKHTMGNAIDVIPTEGTPESAIGRTITDLSRTDPRFANIRSGATFSNLYDPLHVELMNNQEARTPGGAPIAVAQEEPPIPGARYAAYQAPGIASDANRYQLPQSMRPYPGAQQRDWGQQMARSPWMSLVKAGAEMATSVGPIGSVIGKGIKAGTGELEGQRKALQGEEEINQKAQQLYQQAQQHLDEYTRAKPGELLRAQEAQRYHDILERERADALSSRGFPGTGQTPEGDTVQGFYQFNPQSRKYEFQPGITQAPKGSPQAIALQGFMRANPNATPEQTAEFIRSLKPGTASQQAISQSANTAIGLIDESSKMLDDAIAGKTGAVSGISGELNRMWQWGKGTLGMDYDTAPSDFQQRIQLLQTTLPRILAATSRITGAERAEFNNIVGGLSRFKTPEEAKNNLMRLRQILSERGAAGGAGAGAPTAVTQRPAGIPADARQGFDGSWYSEDPNRPGKYLKWGQ